MIHVIYEAFFPLCNRSHENRERGFFLRLWKILKKLRSLSIETFPEKKSQKNKIFSIKIFTMVYPDSSNGVKMRQKLDFFRFLIPFIIYLGGTDLHSFPRSLR